MPVDSKHPDFLKVERDYQRIADCVAGQRAIKKAGERYLPKPNASDTSDENATRYRAYKQRAVFHNATGRTVANLVGQCFAIDPVATVPPTLEPWLADLDGAGVSAIQQSKKALGFVVEFSRALLWVDYPKTAGVVSQADAEEGGIRPKVTLCSPQDVWNWRVTPHGAHSKLSLVVIRETYVSEDDGFEAKQADQFRELRLNDAGIYVQNLWRQTQGGWQIVETLTPQGGDGSPLNYIPAVFIGAEANDCEVEKPLMIDIANVNIGHYRNSADYEETAFMCGQPTLILAGLTTAWVRDHLPKGIQLGCRSAIPLNEGAAASLLQAEPKGVPLEAMEQKEKLMQALGAKLVEKREVQQTATEAGMQGASETSILAACCANVSAAYGVALRWVAMFGNVGVKDPETEILFELNRDFAVARMTPEEQNATLAMFNGGLITFEEARDKLKSGGVAYLDDDDAKEQLDAQAEEDFKATQRELAAQLDAQKKAAPQPANA